MRHLNGVILLPLLMLLLAACSSRRGFPGDMPDVVVSPADRPCVTVGPDGQYEDILYADTGRLVSKHVFAVVKQIWPTAILLESMPETEAANQCRAAGGTYLVMPTILHWEDRATQWSGRPDAVAVGLTLVRLSPFQTVRRGVFDERSTKWTASDQPASELLNDGFDEVLLDLLVPPHQRAERPLPALKSVFVR